MNMIITKNNMFGMNDYYNINLLKLFNFLIYGIGYSTGISPINQYLMKNKWKEPIIIFHNFKCE